MRTVHLAIGNSDDKLTQRDWHRYVRDVQELIVKRSARVHGVWFSLPDSEYQNFCIASEMPDEVLSDVRSLLADLRKRYGQDSIALNVSETEYV